MRVRPSRVTGGTRDKQDNYARPPRSGSVAQLARQILRAAVTLCVLPQT